MTCGNLVFSLLPNITRDPSLFFPQNGTLESCLQNVLNQSHFNKIPGVLLREFEKSCSSVLGEKCPEEMTNQCPQLSSASECPLTLCPLPCPSHPLTYTLSRGKVLPNNEATRRVSLAVSFRLPDGVLAQCVLCLRILKNSGWCSYIRPKWQSVVGTMGCPGGSPTAL